MSKIEKGVESTPHLGNGQAERTYKSILFEVMPEAVTAERSSAGRLDVRGLFYACRRLYLAHPERPRDLEARLAAKKKSEHILEYHYFNTQVVPDYEREHGEIDGLVRDARGHIHEAHEFGSEEIRTEF